MAKLFVILALFAIVALTLAAPAEEKKEEKKDLDTAAGHIYGGYGGTSNFGFLNFNKNRHIF